MKSVEYLDAVTLFVGIFVDHIVHRLWINMSISCEDFPHIQIDRFGCCVANLFNCWVIC